jgi:hypothetical protein
MHRKFDPEDLRHASKSRDYLKLYVKAT